MKKDLLDEIIGGDREVDIVPPSPIHMILVVVLTAIAAVVLFNLFLSA